MVVPKNKISILLQIENKLGFSLDSYKDTNMTEAHEKDNTPNPFDKLTLEELLYLRENGYFR